MHYCKTDYLRTSLYLIAKNLLYNIINLKKMTFKKCLLNKS